MKRTRKNRTLTSILSLFMVFAFIGFNYPLQAQPTQEHLLSHIGKYPNYPNVIYGYGPQADLIKKGEYLAQAGDCIACHTKPGGLPFAGGLPINTPFGIIYSPNITSDKKYGIGNWTLQQFTKAMRDGVAPDGSNYFPVFPYPSFTKITDQDMAALKAYFDAVSPVPQPNQGVDMPWPFRWRLLQDFWKLMYFHKGIFKNDPNESAEWNRGAYLVQGLGHCGMCHTPLNVLGAPQHKYSLTGGFASGSYAPNISFSRLVNISVSEVVNVFVNNKLLSGGAIVGPMAEVVHDSLEYLNKEDLAAIAVYLKSVKSQMPPLEHAKITSKTGRNIYDKYCTGCHGTGSGGAPKTGDATEWAPRLKLGMNNLYKNAINGIGNMPPRGGCGTCSDDEIKAAVDYILKETKATSATTANKPVTQQRSPLIVGKNVYGEVCSICHDQGKLGAPKLGDQQAWAPYLKKNMEVLILRTIHGYKGMPARGACYNCSDTDLIDAVIYMVNKSQSEANYDLW